MATITIKKNVPTDEQVEIDFPLYVKEWDCIEAASWDTWWKISEDGKVYKITHRQPRMDDPGTWKFEVEIKDDLGTNLAYYLTLSKATEKEWQTALTEFRKIADIED